MAPPNYGRCIAHALALRSLKQHELATLAGCDPSMISHIINGDRRPSTKLLEDIAKALGLSVVGLLSPPEVSTSPVSE